MKTEKSPWFTNLSPEVSIEFANDPRLKRLLGCIDKYFSENGLTQPIEHLNSFLHTFLESEDYQEMDELHRANQAYAISQLVTLLSAMFEYLSTLQKDQPVVFKRYEEMDSTQAEIIAENRKKSRSEAA
jgi:hypothetical protein